MDDQLVVLDGSTFLVSEPGGDCQPGRDQGLFHDDIRHLSTWRLLVDGAPLRVLTSRTPDYFAARVFATLADARVGNDPTVTVQRHRVVAGGLHEDLVVENHSDRPRRLRLEVQVDADFADLFEVKQGGRAKRGRTTVEPGPDALTFCYERDGFRRATVVTAGGHSGCRIGPRGLRFELGLEPRERWRTCLQVACQVGGQLRPLRHGCHDLGRLEPDMPLPLDAWLDGAPRLRTRSEGVRRTYRQSLVDLAALRFRPDPELTWSLPAAGLPWFMALFGRDSLIAAYQALPFHAELARSTLVALAAHQATTRDDFADAEPGKILHELRRGELAALGEIPNPSYASHDATLLFLILLDEYERWSGDAELVRRLEPAARAALAWLEGDADPDRDGYLEYRTRSPAGLANQIWKDSWDAIRFADGRLAEPPIATCELQGYAYDARRRAARLARRVWADGELAGRLDRDAGRLRDRFNHDFWDPRRDHFVLALDRTKVQVDALTSNIGHLLWSGIVDDRLADAVAERLLGPDLWTGWGVRTMSARDAAYNPIGYHTGSVWPHDTALAAEGLRRYGYREAATRLASAVLEAAEAFGHRLPELFAGLDRADTGGPVAYPTASRPQAWAAGAPLLALRTLLGLDTVDGRLRAVPYLPAGLDDLRLAGVTVPGTSQTGQAPDARSLRAGCDPPAPP